MKQVSISIHPFSALVGMALLSMVWVSAAAMPLQGSSSDRDVSAIEDVGAPRPQDAVAVHEGTPFVVPDGRLMVVTGMALTTGGTADVFLHFDGSVVLAAEGGNASNSVEDVPFGLVAQAGQVVTCDAVGSGLGVALGYLVDA